LTVGESSTVTTTASTDILIDVTDNLILSEPIIMLTSDLYLDESDDIVVGEELTEVTYNIDIDVSDGLTIGESQAINNDTLYAITSDNITVTEVHDQITSDLYISVISGLTIGESASVLPYVFAYMINVSDGITLSDWGYFEWVNPGGVAISDEDVWNVSPTDALIDDTIVVDSAIYDVTIGDSDNG